MTLLGVVLAGLIGAPTRYLLDSIIAERTRKAFPWGTFAINMSGSFLLGLLTGLALYQGFPGTPKTILGAGFLGSYTTFSTYTYESLRLVEEGARTEALANVLGSVGAGVAAAALGLALAAGL